MEIQLKASIDDDLHWESQIQLAMASSEPLDWFFDFQFKKRKFALEEELFFSAFSLAVETFQKEIFPQFCDRTRRVILYRGSLDFTKDYVWSSFQESQWNEWKGEGNLFHEEQKKRLFCAKAYGAYFQQLSIKLPDEVTPSLEFWGDFQATRAEKEQLFSKVLFPHFDLAANWEEKSPSALLFPEERYHSQEMLERLDAFFASIGEPCRVIHEPFLTEEWEGVDELYVFSEWIDREGIRKLKGFNAAGGVVMTMGPELPIPIQKIFRGRGI